MNVNPVAMPGPALTAQVANSAEPQPIAASTSGRNDVRARPSAVTVEADKGQAKSFVDGSVRTDGEDRRRAEQLKAFISDGNVQLSTYHDEASGRSILEVRDQVTGDVVSQYPSEELIRLYAALRQSFVDRSA